MPLTALPSHLVPDCDQCSGLCCIAPDFAKSDTFAFDKPASVRCPNLQDDFRCQIHENLKSEGFQGCVDYQCFGAGQRVTQHHYPGRTWLSHPEVAERIFKTYFKVKSLHELQSYLVEAEDLAASSDLRTEIEDLRSELNEAAQNDEAVLDELSVADFRERVERLIGLVGEAQSD